MDRVPKYVSAGGMPNLTPGGRGREASYDAVACLAWLRARRTPGTNEQQRTRYFKAMADKLALDLAIKRGKVLLADDVEQLMSTEVVRARNHLRALPARAQAEFGLSDVVTRGIAEFIDLALSELAKTDLSE